jgi:uncharacterized oxidoreductase
MRLIGRTVLITGGSAGIGLAYAARFAALGNEVIVTGRRAGLLAAAKQRIPGLHTIVSDVSDPAQVAELSREVKARFPKLDVLVNNAGVSAYRNLSSPSADLQDLMMEMNVNVGGVIRVTSAFVDRLVAHRGTLINVSSALAFVPLPCLPMYCASKAAIHSYTQSLRFQLESSGVEVIEVMPPAVATDMTVDLPEGDGLTKMSVEELTRLTFQGLERGRQEILPGQAAQLSLMRRLAPSFINRQLWKAAKKLVPPPALTAKREGLLAH